MNCIHDLLEHKLDAISMAMAIALSLNMGRSEEGRYGFRVRHDGYSGCFRGMVVVLGLRRRGGRPQT